MIELFSKHPNNLELKFDTGLTPIHIDISIVSLSAILLNEVYYDVLVKGKRTVDGYSLIEIEAVILFKIKAWLDMNERKEAGEQVDMKNIKKHKNDVFRLLANVSPASSIKPAGEIQIVVEQGQFVVGLHTKFVIVVIVDEVAEQERLCRESLLRMSTGIRLISQASAMLQSPSPCSTWLMPRWLYTCWWRLIVKRIVEYMRKMNSSTTCSRTRNTLVSGLTAP